VQAHDLQVDESLVTGESVPVTKTTEAVLGGTLVARGSGQAIVTATGAKSELGRIGKSLAGVERGKTALEREIGRIVRYIAAIGILLCIVAVAGFAYTRGDVIAKVLNDHEQSHVVFSRDASPRQPPVRPNASLDSVTYFGRLARLRDKSVQVGAYDDGDDQAGGNSRPTTRPKGASSCNGGADRGARQEEGNAIGEDHGDHSFSWQTTSMLCPSGPMTKAA